MEIINTGGISYASYRVARLMEELLAYQPDVFVIYTGHNEFLEKRIYHKRPSLPTGLIRMAVPPDICAPPHGSSDGSNP